jgi:catalase
MVLNRCVDNFFAETEQVAFCTQNIVPGVDFSNDPLLQGRNFSYLDTQLKRLGSPNFTRLEVNAPKCPMATLQQDGHMALLNPKTRANYEPNSWGAEIGGPRETPDRGFHSFASEEEGPKLRVRAEKFADHYSQARQFYISQTEVEQGHIAASFTFELSKVERADIRSRMVSHLLNVDKGLAQKVAQGLRLPEVPKPAEPARRPLTNLKPSPPLSILRNAPTKFTGRKMGALVSDGVDAELVQALRKALQKEGAMLELIAPMVGGVEASDGSMLEAQQKIDGGPSVLYDSVALLISDEGAQLLANEASVRDFIADAFAHCKFIGYVDTAKPLLVKALGDGYLDGGFLELKSSRDTTKFVETCRKLRFWDRESKVKTL